MLNENSAPQSDLSPHLNQLFIPKLVHADHNPSFNGLLEPHDTDLLDHQLQLREESLYVRTRWLHQSNEPESFRPMNEGRCVTTGAYYPLTLSKIYRGLQDKRSKGGQGHLPIFELMQPSLS